MVVAATTEGRLFPCGGQILPAENGIVKGAIHMVMFNAADAQCRVIGFEAGALRAVSTEDRDSSKKAQAGSCTQRRPSAKRCCSPGESTIDQSFSTARSEKSEDNSTASRM